MLTAFCQYLLVNSPNDIVLKDKLEMLLTSGGLKTEDSLLQYCQHQTPNHTFKTQINSGPMGVAQDI